MRASGWFLHYILEPEVGSFNIYGSRRWVLATHTGSRRLVLSIYTGAGGWFSQYMTASGWFLHYIREPEVGSFNIYGSRRLVVSLFTAARDWSFQYIR